MAAPQHLEQGYRRFRAERYAIEAERYRTLAHGQRPATMIIGCADSRVDPATIFSAAPGELFVVRNVAALVPPYEESGTYHGTSAAIEFAVVGLEVSSIVVLGHRACGGVAAALASTEARPVGRFIAPWVELLVPARQEVVERLAGSDAHARQHALEHEAVRLSLANLQTFPFVRDAIATRAMTLSGALFSIADGKLEWIA